MEPWFFDAPLVRDVLRMESLTVPEARLLAQIADEEPEWASQPLAVYVLDRSRSGDSILLERCVAPASADVHPGDRVVSNRWGSREWLVLDDHELVSRRLWVAGPLVVWSAAAPDGRP